MSLVLTLARTNGELLEKWDLDDLTYEGNVMADEEVEVEAKKACVYVNGIGWCEKEEATENES